ncbi:DASH family cryptochrome [Vibrio sp. MA40-2]|uniref:DASH family cryptochrome n=1 Tax=Vibrio sp. MA40-2 TaxID=3391828 RepID=UPI0039A4D4CB
MKKAIYWFSNDLCLQDNRSLAALLTQADQIAFVYVVDPRWFEADNYQHKRLGQHRWRLICQSMQQLDSQLRAHGHQLSLFSGHVEQVMISLVKEHQINAVGHCAQIGLYEQRAWQKIQQSLPEVEFVSDWDTTLFSERQLTLSKQHLSSFSKFRKLVEKEPLHPFNPTVISLRSLPSPLVLPTTTPDALGTDWKHLPTFSINSSTLKPHDESEFHGGELNVIEHLEGYFQTLHPRSYKQTRNALDGWQNSTKMSHFLALGNLSARQLWHQLKQYEVQYGANESTYWIGFELLWRDYFQWSALLLNDQLFRFQGGAERAPSTRYNEERFQQWCEGNTPFSLVNALMTELNQTGYMTNRGRQIAASCLVNELGVDWRFGAAYFQQQLVDHDVASNWGNWQYIAGVGADPRGGRHFNIEKQTLQFDPDGSYRNKWLGTSS